MNFFPYVFPFKNENLYNLSYSYQHGYQYPFMDPNQVSLSQYQYCPSLWNGNNGLIQNFKEQSQTQHSNSISCKSIPSLSQQEHQKSQQTQINLLVSPQNPIHKEKKQKKVFKQKEGRNMISNLFRQALKAMLNQKDRTLQIIEKISLKHHIEINGREFLESITKKLKNLKNYVRIGQIEIFLKGKDTEKSRDHAKVLRVLVYEFLRSEVIPCLCNNPKVQSTNRWSHIQQVRKFQELLLM